jgi:hypothetical protein
MKDSISGHDSKMLFRMLRWTDVFRALFDETSELENLNTQTRSMQLAA